MSRSADDDVLTIGTVAERTGTTVALLRAWEQRYRFPRPARSPSGHRRYSSTHVEQIRQVLRDKAAGLSLEAAIGRLAPAEPSIFAGLRRRRPDLTPHVLTKRTMLAISHAIEDEYGTGGAGAPVLVAAFQEERFWRASEPRYRDLARTAVATLVFAELAVDPPLRGVDEGPVEIPLAGHDPLLREWAVVCDTPEGGACLAGRERPGQHGVDDRARLFEALWSVEPDVVRAAVGIATGIALRHRPDLDLHLEVGPSSGAAAGATGDEEMRRATALTNRIVAYTERSATDPGKRRA